MKLSVIIPALDEQDRIEACLASVTAGKQQPGASETELIVVDGGSEDATVRKARAAGAQEIGPQRGRARQMNAGAAIAAGDTLLFLHADTHLPPGFRDEIHRIRLILLTLEKHREVAEKHLKALGEELDHGRGFVSHAILGSTAERVLRHAFFPCFIVRDPSDRK